VAAPQLLSSNAGQGPAVPDVEDGTLDGSAVDPVAAVPIGTAPVEPLDGGALLAPAPLGAAPVAPLDDGGALLMGAIVGVGEGAGAI
jgi:hypothetical protein